MDTVLCACGKVAHPSRKRAKEAATRIKARARGGRRPPLSIYTCEHGSIHLTSQKHDNPQERGRRRGR